MDDMIIGFCINVFLWLLGTTATVVFGLWGFVASFLCMTALMLVRLISHEKGTQQLVSEFRSIYGFNPPRASRTAASRVAAGAGGFTGHLYTGVLVGGLFDLAAHVKEAHSLTADQYQFVNRIKGRQAWTPLYGFLLLGAWFCLTGGAVWVLSQS